MEKKSSKKRIIINCIFVGIILIFVLLTFMGRNDAVIVTSNYGTGTEEEKEYVNIVFGDNAEENFNLYFKWYNVIHESGHIITRLNSNKTRTNAEEEILVNRYATAYWRRFGEEEKLQKLKEIVDNAQGKLTNPAPDGVTIYEWIEENYSIIQTRDTFFNDYGYFQFSTNKDVLNKEERLEDVLYEMTGKKIEIEDKKLKYDFIDNDTCDKIIEDETEMIHSWGLKFPKKVEHLYEEGTSNNYSVILLQGYIIIYGIMIIVIIIIMFIFNIVYSIKQKNRKK